jgi:hypothetical protein
MLSLLAPKAAAAQRPGRSVLLGNRRTIKGPAVPFQIGADGIWTWFSDPRAVFRNGATYVGSIRSNGRPNVHKYDHAAKSGAEFVLTGTFQADDHNNAALVFATDGKLWANYSKHNDADGNRLRVTSAAEDISAWSTEAVVASAGAVAYSNTHYLSATGRYYNHFRRGVSSQWAISSDDLATWDTEREWIVNGGERPYVKACNNGVDRIDLLFTTGHPSQTVSSVYHCYMQLDAGVEKFYKTDGTYIGTGSVTPAQASLVWDASAGNGEAWTWEMAIGADGHPRALFTRFPSTSDHRYMHGRWTGSAWVTSEITAGGGYLYAAEEFYSGGLCFDANDTTRVYLSKYVTDTWEIQEWRTGDDGATWALFRDITAASGAGVVNGRPYSPRNHDGQCCCVWWRGTYTDFTSFSTAVYGVARQ